MPLYNKFLLLDTISLKQGANLNNNNCKTIKMSKLYINPQKIFTYLGVILLGFGVSSCASTQSTAAASGETDGVYYSPYKDGQIDLGSTASAQSYDIQVGSPYFDANGKGAEDFYYDDTSNQTQQAQSNNTVQVTGNNVYVGSSNTSDWGRYDGLDITINNYGGYYNPWWGFGYSSWYWSYPRYSWYYPYWGGWSPFYSPYYGGYYGYSPYWGSSYYGGYYGGYYGSYYGGNYGYYGNSYWNRGTAVRPGSRPGSGLAQNGSPYRSNTSNRTSQMNNNDRPVRGINSSVGSNSMSSNSDNRPVRNVRTAPSNQNTTGAVRTTNPNMQSNQNNTGGVRTTNPNMQSNQNNTGGVRPTSGMNENAQPNTRPIRATAPANTRPNAPIRTQQSPGTRTNPNMQTSPGTRSNSNMSQPSRNTQPNRSSTPSMRSNTGSSNTGGMRSSGGGVRSSGGSRR